MALVSAWAAGKKFAFTASESHEEAAGKSMDAADSNEGFGLAGAEQRLINLQLDQGRLAVQRQILQLRVDYLTNLNTQTMLLAGAAVGMLSSLELEAIQPEEVDRRRMIITATYIFCSSISLGSSIWVLYTSNNLINLATMTTLHASDLKGVTGADLVLELRMNDVRKMYMLALVTMLPALFVM